MDHITITRNDDTPVIAKYTGELKVTADIVLNGKSYHLERSLFVGTDIKPAMTKNGKPIGLATMVKYTAGTTFQIDCSNVPRHKLRWELNIPGVGTRQYTNVQSITAKPTEAGTLTVKAINMFGCSDDNYQSVSFTIQKLTTVIIPGNPIIPGQPIKAKIYNELPAEENTMSVMSANSANTANVTRVPYDGECVVEVWSNSYGRVASYNCFGSDVSIPSSGLTKGVYHLKLIIDGEQKDVAAVVVN